MAIRIIIILLLMTSVCSSVCHAKPRRLFTQKEVDRRMEMRELDKIVGIRVLLSKDNIESINTWQEWQTYEKKKARILRKMLKKHYIKGE